MGPVMRRMSSFEKNDFMICSTFQRMTGLPLYVVCSSSKTKYRNRLRSCPAVVEFFSAKAKVPEDESAPMLHVSDVGGYAKRSRMLYTLKMQSSSGFSLSPFSK